MGERPYICAEEGGGLTIHPHTMCLCNIDVATITITVTITLGTKNAIQSNGGGLIIHLL